MTATTSSLIRLAQSWSGDSLNLALFLPWASFDAGEPPTTIAVPGSSAFLRAAEFHPSDRLVGLAKYDTITLYDLEKRQAVGSLVPHALSITGLLFSSDGSQVVSGAMDGRIATRDLVASRAVYDLRLAAPVSCLAASADGGVVAAGLWNGDVQLFDARENRQSLKIEAHNGYVSAVQFSPDGALLATAGNDRTLNLFDVRGVISSYAKFHRHLDTPLTVEFDEDGRVWSGSKVGELQAWDCCNGKSMFQQKIDGASPIYRVIYSPCRKAIVYTAVPPSVCEAPIDALNFGHARRLVPSA
jgi:WD40 repeat protein